MLWQCNCIKLCQSNVIMIHYGCDSGNCETTAPAILEGFPTIYLGHTVSEDPGITQGVEHREEPLLAITQFY